MKILLIIFFGLIIFTKSALDLPICNLQTAKQALPPKIFAETTIDGPSQNTFITRFFHNKAGIFLHEFSRCYFNAIDPNFIYKSTSFIGLITWTYFAYRIFNQRLWIPIVIFLFIPIVPFINLPTLLVVSGHKIFAIIGLVFLAKNHK